MMNILAFDIETIPDTAGGARLYDLHGLDDEDIARAMATKRQQKTGSEFLPPHQQRIVAISIAFRKGNSLRVESLGEKDSSEAELIQLFYDGIDRHSPTLVSWNGAGFDLPVLHYRSLLHGINARRYWENGDDDRGFRYNNYLSRFHWRHIDLMDVLAGFSPRNFAPLDEVAVMLGFPGKLGIGGAKVWQAYCEGKIAEIRDYCEVDVLNTFLVYLKWEVVRGGLSEEAAAEEFELVADTLKKSERGHFAEFLKLWQDQSKNSASDI